MGWNSWNAYREKLDAQVVRDTADALVSSGLASKGYRFVNMDDTWAGGRDSVTGVLFADHKKFPGQIPALASYVHAKVPRLFFGIYTDVGHKTCAKAPGTWGHEEIDAITFAKWEVDFVKSDSCFTQLTPTLQPANATNCEERYKLFAKKLQATGRDMVHSVKGPCGRPLADCSPPDASGFSNLRRAAGDAKDNFDSMLRILEYAAPVVQYSRPGYFADLDILEIGNGGLTAVEERSVFTLWCALKSPLLLGNNLTSMNASTLATVGNTALIRVNQDALGKAALLLSNTSAGHVWGGPLLGSGTNSTSERDAVLVLFNPGETPTTTVAAWSLLSGLLPSTCHRVRATDLWEASVISHSLDGPPLVATLGAHASAAWRLSCIGMV